MGIFMNNNLVVKDFFDESVVAGDTVWSLEWEQDYSVTVQQWLVDQVLNHQNVALLFIGPDQKERKRANKSVKKIAKSRTQLIEVAIKNIEQQRLVYETNLNSLNKALLLEPAIVVVNKDEVEL
jgi:putative ribosome biogenesis GTPase RsgA